MKEEREEKTFGVKFNHGIYISTELLDKWNIKYENKDLTDNPVLGMCYEVPKE